MALFSANSWPCNAGEVRTIDLHVRQCFLEELQGAISHYSKYLKSLQCSNFTKLSRKRKI